MLVAALTLSACGGRGVRARPEAAVRAMMAALQSAQGDARARARVYALLSTRSQEALQHRAQLSSQMSGFTLEPWEMIAPGRIRMRVIFDASTTTTARVQGDTAVVTVRDRRGGSAEVPLVREADQWRIDLEVPVFVQGPAASDAAAPQVP